MKAQIHKATTSKLVQLFIQDTSKTDGSGLTGLTFGSGSLTAYYYREGAASAVSISLQTMTAGAWASGGFVDVDGTNLPGVYQIGLPDAALATGVNSVLVMLKGATNMAPVLIEIQLTDTDVNNATNFGLADLDATISSRLAAASISLAAGAVTVGTNNDKTGYALAANAVDAGQFTQAAADKVWLSAARTLTSFGSLVADVAAAVWASATRTLTSFGTLVADGAAAVWAYVTRTLTQSAAQVIATVSGTDVTLRRGETIAVPFTALGSLTGRSKLWFTVKHLDSDVDTAAIIQIVETTGLVYLNGAAGTAGNGSLVVTDATTGALTRESRGGLLGHTRARSGLHLRHSGVDRHDGHDVDLWPVHGPGRPDPRHQLGE